MDCFFLHGRRPEHYPNFVFPKLEELGRWKSCLARLRAVIDWSPPLSAEGELPVHLYYDHKARKPGEELRIAYLSCSQVFHIYFLGLDEPERHSLVSHQKYIPREEPQLPEEHEKRCSCVSERKLCRDAEHHLRQRSRVTTGHYMCQSRASAFVSPFLTIR